MSTYVLMRLLESAPSRYDLGIRLLTFGRLDRTYDRLAGLIERRQQVLDIGCGTGALTLRAARRGALVKGIDVDARMLEIAARRAAAAGLADTVQLVEMGVAELEAERAQNYDAILSGLCFSELSDDEIGHTLREAARILRPGGLLLVADELKSRHPLKRLLQVLIRAPLVALTYVVTQQTSRPTAGLATKLVSAGFAIRSARESFLESFGEYVAQKAPAR